MINFSYEHQQIKNGKTIVVYLPIRSVLGQIAGRKDRKW